MVEKIPTTSLSIVERNRLIRLQPCFSLLQPHEADELAQLLTETTFAPNETIVMQGADVDRVFLIVDGLAEVSQDQSIQNNIQLHVPLAVLGPAESIGLSEKGLFSATGKRTATVTALTHMKVLVLDVVHLNMFFGKHAHVPIEILASSEKMLRAYFVKQALSFENLTDKQVAWLTTHIEEKYYCAGDIIFNQGEQGDCCYLIYSGKVEITKEDADGKEHILAVLTAPAFFGEMTLLTNTARNATARMQEDGELLVLKHEYLLAMMDEEKTTADNVMKTALLRSCPKQNPHVVAFQRKTADGQDVVILKNPDNEKYCQMALDGWLIWRRLNGTFSWSDLQEEALPERVFSLLSRLVRDHFVELSN